MKPVKDLGKFKFYWQGDEACEWCQSLGTGLQFYELCVTSKGFKPAPTRKKLGACFTCSRNVKGCSRGKLFCNEVSDTAKRVWLEENGNGGTVAFLGEGPPEDVSRKQTPKQIRDMEITDIPESTGDSSMANDNVKNKIQDKTGKGLSRMQEHMCKVEAMVHDRERESGEVLDMEDDGDDLEGVEIGMREDKIQDKDLVSVGCRPAMCFKATYAPRPAVVQNKIQDKTPERTQEKRACVEGRHHRHVENDALTAVVNELGVESPDEDDEDDELREVKAVMWKG